jgi:hypothetical protein
MPVLAALPEGWTATLSDVPAHEILGDLELKPGDVRLIR